MTKSIIKQNNELSATELIEYESIQELMQIIDEKLGSLPDTLDKLNRIYEDAEKHRSSDAIRIRFEIIKYINDMRGIRVEKKSKPINIAIFNNYDKGETLNF